MTPAEKDALLVLARPYPEQAWEVSTLSVSSGLHHPPPQLDSMAETKKVKLMGVPGLIRPLLVAEGDLLPCGDLRQDRLGLLLAEACPLEAVHRLLVNPDLNWRARIMLRSNAQP